MTRLDALPFALFILVWAAAAQRWPIRRAVAVLGLLAVVLVPTLAGYGRSRGDVAPASTEIATNNWREVFKDRLGEPGFEPDRRVTATRVRLPLLHPVAVGAVHPRRYARIYGEEVFVSHYYLLANGTAGWGRYLGLHSSRFVPLLFLAGTVGLLLAVAPLARGTWLVPGAVYRGRDAADRVRRRGARAPGPLPGALRLHGGAVRRRDGGLGRRRRRGRLARRLARVRALDRSGPAPAQPARPAGGRGEAGRGLALRRGA